MLHSPAIDRTPRFLLPPLLLRSGDHVLIAPASGTAARWPLRMHGKDTVTP